LIESVKVLLQETIKKWELILYNPHFLY
jgi:hypothetical protein